MTAERGHVMEGDRLSKQAEFTATILAIFEASGAELSADEKAFVRYVVRLIAKKEKKSGEPLFDIAAMTLASYDLLARVLEESSDELPLAFKSFDVDRLRQLVDIIAPHIHAFAESSRRSPS